MDSTALSYTDALIKEYLLFRGFAETLHSFSDALRGDKVQGFQVDRICNLLFHHIIPTFQCTHLLDLLQELDHHVYCRLDRQYEDAIGRMEVALVRLFMVTAIKAGRPEKVKELLDAYGELLLSAREGAAWHAWFTLPYISRPDTHPQFQVFFSPRWAAMVESSFRNFLTAAFQQLPLPALLRFDADRAKRAELQQALEATRRENADLREKLGLPAPIAGTRAPSATPAQPPRRLASAALYWTGGGVGGAVAAALETGLPGTSPLPSSPPLHAEAPPAEEGGREGLQRRSPCHAPAAPEVPAGRYEAGDGSGPTVALGSWGRRQGVEGEARLQLQGGVLEEVAEVLSTSHSCVNSQGSLEMGGAGDGEALQGGVSAGREGGGGGTTAPVDGVAGQGPHHYAHEPGLAEQGVLEGGVGREQPPAQPLHGMGEGVLSRVETVVGCGGQGGASAPISCCAFSPSGCAAAWGGADGVVRVWEAGEGSSRSGSPRREAGAWAGSEESLGGGGGAVTRLAWDQQEGQVLVVGSARGGIRGWHRGRRKQAFQVPAEVDAPLVAGLACSPLDPTLAVATSPAGGGPLPSRVSLWSLRGLRKGGGWGLAIAGGVTSLCYSPGGGQLAVAGMDGRVRLWDPSSRQQAAAWAAGDPSVPCCARFLGAGTLVATLSADGYIKLWSTAMLREPLAGLHLPQCCARGGAGASALSGSGTEPPSQAGVAGGSGDDGVGMLPPQGGSYGGWPGGEVVQWRPDISTNAGGSAFATTSVTGEVPVVWVVKGEQLQLEAGDAGHMHAVTAVDWRPGGSQLLTGASDGSLMLSAVKACSTVLY